jgi:long-chain fatty acid transport protein
MRCNKFSKLVLAITALSTFASGTVFAETLIPALGARSAGRGGTNFAFDDSGYVLHDNPAGLIGVTSFKKGKRIDFYEANVAGLFPNLHYSDPQNSNVQATNDPFGMGAFTIGHRVNNDLAVGFGVYTPAGFGAKWNMEGPPGPLAGPRLYKSLGMLIRALPGVSYQMTDRLRLGATLGVAASHIELEGPYYVNSAPLTGVPTLLDLQSTGAALTWSGGLQYKWSERLTLAGRYQSQNEFHNDGNARVTIPGIGTSFYDANVGITWPRSVGVGLQYKLSRSRRLGLDVDWQQWSKAYDQIDLRFSNGDNPVFDLIAGPVVREAFPLNWKDSIVAKGGLEQDLSGGRTIRTGYSFNSDAVIGATATPYLPTILMHYFTMGYSWQKNGWTYDTAYQYSFRPTLHVASSSLAGGDNSNSSMNTRAHWIFMGVTRRF